MAPSSDGADASDARLLLLDQLRQTERRAASARVASVIGHLIGTPLNVIAGRAALIRGNPSAESVQENARRIEEQVDRVAARIRRLIDWLTVPEQAAPARLVAHILDDVLALYGPISRQRGVTVTCPQESIPAARVEATPALVVLTSLLSLALRTAKPESVVEIRVNEQTERTVLFELLVPGMATPSTRLDRLEPPEDGDHGDSDQLQVLSVCFAIMLRSSGRLEVAAAGEGSVVRCEFPLSA